MMFSTNGVAINCLMSLSETENLEPKFEAFVMSVSFVCESNAGFSICAFTNTHKWFFT